MGRIIRTDRLHKWVWITFHPVKWRQTKNVRNALSEAIDRIEVKS